jgi:O-antigen biosynthesis protein
VRTREPLTVGFVVPRGGRSGGLDIIAEHSRRLNSLGGFETELVTPGELATAPHRYDIGVATWWETAAALDRANCGRRVMFLQSLEHLWYRPAESFESLAAALPLVLYDDFVAVSSWLCEAVTRLHPGGERRLVPNGVDKAIFAPREMPASDGTAARAPLRVLVEGQPSIWLKGIADAAAVVRRMREPAVLTLVALAPDSTDEVGADRVLVGLRPDEMARLYAESDVVLKLSRVEGLGMAPLEAFHIGVPCVVTPYPGHEDYVVHGVNGLVAGFDDLDATAGMLDLLARDRGVLRRLGEGALRTAQTWPDRQRSADLLAGALRAIAHEPPRAGDADGADALSLVRQLTEVTRSTHSGLALALEAGALVEARRLVHELSVSRDECSERLERATADLDTIRSSLLYKVIARARNTFRREPQWPLG